MDDFFLWFGVANTMTVVIAVVGGAIVAWIAAYKGASEGARLNFNWERYKEIKALKESLARSVVNAGIRLSSEYKKAKELNQDPFIPEDGPTFLFETCNFIKLDDEEQKFIVGVETLTTRRHFEHTVGQIKEYFEKNPRIKEAILREREGKEISDNLFKKIADCENRYKKKIKSVVEVL